MSNGTDSVRHRRHSHHLRESRAAAAAAFYATALERFPTAVVTAQFKDRL